MILNEYSFKGFIKDMQQKLNGDKYLKEPHTIISFTMTPPMDQKTFEKIVEDIVFNSQCANLGIQFRGKPDTETKIKLVKPSES